jgi:hypothetical protein
VVRDTGGGKKTTTLTLRSPGKIQTNYPDSIQVSSRSGTGPDQVLSIVPEQVRPWAGPLLVQIQSRSGPGPCPGPVPVRSRSGSFIIRSGDKLINGSCRCSLIFT